MFEPWERNLISTSVRNVFAHLLEYYFGTRMWTNSILVIYRYNCARPSAPLDRVRLCVPSLVRRQAAECRDAQLGGDHLPKNAVGRTVIHLQGIFISLLVLLHPVNTRIF